MPNLLFFMPVEMYGMRLRVHVGIDAKAHRRHHAHGPGHLVQHLHLLFRLDVEHQNAGAQRILHLIPRLAHAREDHLARVGAGLEHPEELAAGNDVEPRALVHEGAQHPKVGVGLDREADQMATRGKGLVETRKASRNWARLYTYTGVPTASTMSLTGTSSQYIASFLCVKRSVTVAILHSPRSTARWRSRPTNGPGPGTGKPCRREAPDP